MPYITLDLLTKEENEVTVDVTYSMNERDVVIESIVDDNGDHYDTSNFYPNVVDTIYDECHEANADTDPII